MDTGYVKPEDKINWNTLRINGSFRKLAQFMDKYETARREQMRAYDRFEQTCIDPRFLEGYASAYRSQELTRKQVHDQFMNECDNARFANEFTFKELLIFVRKNREAYDLLISRYNRQELSAFICDCEDPTIAKKFERARIIVEYGTVKENVVGIREAINCLRIIITCIATFLAVGMSAVHLSQYKLSATLLILLPVLYCIRLLVRGDKSQFS